jgi:hypothetical protein
VPKTTTAKNALKKPLIVSIKQFIVLDKMQKRKKSMQR